MGINSTMVFKINGEDIEFPAYKKGNSIIVSFSRLRKFYNNNKEKLGVNDHIKFCDSKIGTNGEVAHAFVCVNLTSKDFNYDYIGEVTSMEYRDDIDKKFPLSIAYNRALSSALLSYFGFPEKTYTTVQFLADDANEDANEAVVETTESVKEEAVPTMGEDEAIPYSTESADTKAVTFPDPKPVKEVEETKAEEVKTEEVKVETKEDSTSSITMNSEVGFGKYSSLTIAEVIDKKNAGDEFATTFITMIKSGKVVQKDERGKEVVAFIKKNA